MALDRPRFTKEALNGYAPPADATGLAESQKKWKDATLAQGIPGRAATSREANKLLDAAGLARGAGRDPGSGGARRADALHLADRAGLDGLAGARRRSCTRTWPR